MKTPIRTPIATTIVSNTPVFEFETAITTAPTTYMGQIRNLVDTDKKEHPFGFVPLYTSQFGTPAFIEPNTATARLKILTPQGKPIKIETMEEVVPRMLKYEFQKGIRPETRSLLSIP